MSKTKLTDRQKKKIIADYVDNGNYSQTARMNEVSIETVRRIIKANKDDFVKKSEIKKRENTQSTLDYMEKQHESKKRILDKLLHAIEIKCDDIDMFTNIKDLATAYGIIIDKELKVLELKNQKQGNEQLEKVEELLSKIEQEANK